MATFQSTTSGQKFHIVKSVARTLETLEFFDEFRKPVNVVEVSEKLGYPQSSAAALLKSMVAMGYLEYNSKGRTYFPTDRVPLIGSWMNPPLYAEGALVRLLNAIMERSGLSVLLAARNGDDAQYIQVVNPEGMVTHHISLGTRRPLGTSGVGHALLATMTNTQIRRMFHRINAYRNENDEVVDIAKLIEALDDFRKKGYFVSTDRVVRGAGLIAMLVPQECTDRPLCIGVGGPSKVILEKQQELVTMMREEIVRYFGSYIEKPAQVNQTCRMPLTKRGKILAAGMR